VKEMEDEGEARESAAEKIYRQIVSKAKIG
jgi:hypothetical protein